MIRHSIGYSLVCGFLIIILFFLSLFFNANPFIDLSQLFFDFLIFSIFIFFGIYSYKKAIENEQFHFWQGMTISFLIYIPAIILFALVVFISFKIDPSILEDYKLEAMDFLLEKKDIYIEQFGEKQFEEQKSAILEINSIDLILMSVVKKAIVGLFISPIASIIFRKNINKK
jgi:ABC-type transport system involved in multi-copper enzyme maturation permease subunit